LGIRNGLYGVRMAPILQVKGVKRIMAAQVTIDESTGVALAQSDKTNMKRGFWFTGYGVLVFWNIFTLIGALSAKAMGNPAAWGLDAAVPAAFLGLLWPRLKAKDTFAIAAVAVIFALTLSPFVPAGVPIISSALIAVILGWRK
jgi:predicted branched-subunit amino acid permease